MNSIADSSDNQTQIKERKRAAGKILLFFTLLLCSLFFAGLRANAGWETNAEGGKMFKDESSGKYLTGQKTIDGNQYYFNSKGVIQTGFVTIKNKLYYFQPNGKMVVDKSFKVDEKKYRAKESGALYTSKWYPKQNSSKAVYYQADGSMAVNTWVGSVYVGANGRATGKTKTGWVTLEGNKYYAASGGKYKTGWFKVGKKTYYANSKGVVQTSTWVGNKYVKKSGVMATGKYTVGNKTYIFKSNGEKNTKWTSYNGKYYYCGKNGVVRKNKWVKNKYYVNSDGERLTGKQTIDGKTYYFNKSGVKQTGTVKIKKKLYRFNKKTGVMYKNGWISNKYYAKSNGVLLTGLNAVNGDLYYFKSTNGAKIKDKKKTVSGDTYYFGSDGKAVRSQWEKIGGSWYYFQSTGKMAKSTRVQYNGVYYKVGSDGKRGSKVDSGWYTKSGKTYYCDADGKKVTGLQTIDGNKYYFNSKGVMQTGLQTIGGTSYYFDTDGKMVTASGSNKGATIANYALKYVGNPYVYGGTSLTKGADCSGFVQTVFANNGIKLLRTADEQMKGPSSSQIKSGYAQGTTIKVSTSTLMPGDLIFYGSGNYASHVAIYIGDGKIVHASNSQPYPSGGIKVSNYNYNSNILKAVRYW